MLLWSRFFLQIVMKGSLGVSADRLVTVHSFSLYLLICSPSLPLLNLSDYVITQLKAMLSSRRLLQTNLLLPIGMEGFLLEM